MHVYKQVIDIEEVILEFLTYSITIRYIPTVVVVALVVFAIRTISYTFVTT